MSVARGKGKQASVRKRPAKSTAERPSVAAVVQQLGVDIRRDGFVKKAEVTKRAGRDQLLEVFDGLTGAGFEVGARTVRQPLEAQLEAAVCKGAIGLASLAKAIGGATPTEVKSAAASLVERGRLQWIVRGKDLLLVDSTVAVLDERSRDKLTEAVAALGALLKLAARSRAGLLVTDVERLLPALKRPSAAREISDVAALVSANREPSGLTSVPKLVRLLGGLQARESVHADLLRGVRAGRFELRPESGLGRLSPEDAALCVPGPQGSKLSWIRVVEEPS